MDAAVAVTEASLRAMLAATRSTPIVMVLDDPVASGLIASLARPGGRITGLAFQTLASDAKRLQLLKEAISNARRLGYLAPVPPTAAHEKRITESMAGAAAQLDVPMTMRFVAVPGDYAAAFASMKADGAAGVVIAASQPLAVEAPRVVASAAEHGLPTICQWEYMARIGCVFSYGHDLAYAHRRVGEYVVRILQGANPAELPVEQPDAWTLTVNTNAAARLGLTIPHSLLIRADEVIE